MSTGSNPFNPFARALVLALSLLPTTLWAREPDPLPDARARMAVEAQRVEKEFTEGRALAYKLVRTDQPDAVTAVAKLHTLLTLVREDTSLQPARREVLLVTLKADIDRVKEIAADRRRVLLPAEATRTVREDMRRAETERRASEGKRASTDAESIIAGRGRTVVDAGRGRRDSGDRVAGVLRTTEEAAIPDTRDYVLPRDWAEKSMRRSSAAKLTARERQILKVLDTVIDVDFRAGDIHTLSQILDYLEKKTGLSLPVDKATLEEVGASYDSTINLRLKATTRTILKRVLGELNLAYIIDKEDIRIMSVARARETTTTRTYYVGDLAAVVDVRLGAFLSRLQMIENINRTITLITQTIEPSSWKVNNPEAPGTITFDPITMSLIVKQTAEVHYALSGAR
jgi:hypothetical protein